MVTHSSERFERHTLHQISAEYLFAVLPVTDDIKSLKVKNIPLSPTNLVAASVLGYWYSMSYIY